MLQGDVVVEKEVRSPNPSLPTVSHECHFRENERKENTVILISTWRTDRKTFSAVDDQSVIF